MMLSKATLSIKFKQIMEEITFLTIPGLASSGPAHWQTLWEKGCPTKFIRVEQNNWDLPVCHDWIIRLNEEIQKLHNPVYLVAHSLGCLTVVHWANNYASNQVKGAFLVAPADAEKSRNLSFVEGFSPIPNIALPFDNVVIASTNDPYASIERTTAFAQAWGSRFVNVGAKGHINANSSLGIWQEGQALLDNFIHSVEEKHKAFME